MKKIELAGAGITYGAYLPAVAMSTIYQKNVR
jgi:hypothetical protein